LKSRGMKRKKAEAKKIRQRTRDFLFPNFVTVVFIMRLSVL